MALTEAQKRAQRKYVRESVKQMTVRFYPSESDIWEWLNAQGNKASYIKALIRHDMEGHSSQD